MLTHLWGGDDSFLPNWFQVFYQVCLFESHSRFKFVEASHMITTLFFNSLSSSKPFLIKRWSWAFCYKQGLVFNLAHEVCERWLLMKPAALTADFSSEQIRISLCARRLHRSTVMIQRLDQPRFTFQDRIHRHRSTRPVQFISSSIWSLCCVSHSGITHFLRSIALKHSKSS